MNVGEVKRRRKGRKAALLTGAILLSLSVVTGWFSWDNLRFWWVFEPIGENGQGCPQYRHRQSRIVFVQIPGGVEPADGGGGTMPGFLLAKHPLSGEDWAEVFEFAPITDPESGEVLPEVYADHCDGYCELTGLRFPTPKQWSYAVTTDPERWGLEYDRRTFEWARKDGTPRLMSTLDEEATTKLLDSDERRYAFRPAYYPLP